MTPTPRRTFLFGNGLSLAFNVEHYLLPNLTTRVRGRLANMAVGDDSLLTHLDGIAKSMQQDGVVGAPMSFEDIAGPVDRLANTLSAFGPLSRVATPEQRAVLGDLEVDMRALYTRVVGAVLDEVVQHPPSDVSWHTLSVIGAALTDETRRQDELDVFCLNYDALLDMAVIDATQGPPRRAFLSDEFHGLPPGERPMVPVYTPDGSLAEVPALPWRVGPYYPPGPHLRLHHLHGAATWMRFNDRVWKALRLQHLRDCGLFAAWAEGIERPGEVGAVIPVVLLVIRRNRRSVDRPSTRRTRRSRPQFDMQTRSSLRVMRSLTGR